MRRWLGVVGILLLVGGVRASGQSTPQTQPLLQPSAITYDGDVLLPWTDGTCNNDGQHSGCLYWGGEGASIAPGTNQMTLGCFDRRSSPQVAKVALPAQVGGTGTILQRCVTLQNITQIDGGDPNGYVVGGSLEWQGRAIFSAYGYYDNAPVGIRSHWAMSPTLTGQVGPVRVGSGTETQTAGRLGGYMALIPAAWRALLSGPALTGLCCISIIGRSNYGPGFGVFDPANIGKVEPVPVTTLASYPDEARSIAQPGSTADPNPIFNFSTEAGGLFWPEGTRTVIFVEKHGKGRPCYGPSEGSGATCAHDPGNPTTHNSYHAYPYSFTTLFFDANDLLAVKDGKRTPWSVRPYAVGELPGVTNTVANIRSIAYEPVSRKLYVIPSYGDTPRAHVFSVAAPSTQPPPPTEICGDGIDNDGDGLIDEGCIPQLPDIFEYVETIVVPATTVTVPAQTVLVPGQTITRTLLCSRSKGTCVVK